MASTKRVTVVKDDVDKVFASIRELLGKQVLIGIPEDKAARTDDEAMNNAAIAYVMEFGSPAQNIPARAFLIPGVEKARTPALRQLRLAAKYALDGNTAKSDAALSSAGVVGSESVRNEIINGDFAPLSPATIAKRYKQRGDKTRRQSEIDYLKFVAQGVQPDAAQAEVGIRPLFNTGEMFRSITYVVQKVE